MKRLLCLLSIFLSLQGCVAAFVAGAAAGGLIVYDRRTLQTVADDQSLTYTLSNKISTMAASYPPSHIIVESFDHVILLAGESPSSELREKAADLARNQPKVRKVYNEITVAGPSNAMTRSGDTWITTKIRTSMLATKGLRSTQIKIVTVNGMVYLMGSVTAQQANLAVEVARRAYGVQRVVKLFE